MLTWPTIKKGSIVDIVAPSGKIDPENIPVIKAYVESLGLIARIPDDLLGDHPFSANHDEIRLKHLQDALLAKDSDMIWCVRGGHGTTRILPDLLNLPKPEKNKLVIGFSDITSIHVWLNQAWQWPTLHGPMARQVACMSVDERDVASLHQLWFQGLQDYVIEGLQPLNQAAKNAKAIQGKTVGTCATLLQSTFGTPWQVDTRNKILLLEDINERPYALDRLLVHLANAGIFNEVCAIVFGDFTEKLGAPEVPGLDKVIENFVEAYLPKRGINVPVYRLRGLGHSERNCPLPLGVEAKISLQNGGWQLVF